MVVSENVFLFGRLYKGKSRYQFHKVQTLSDPLETTKDGSIGDGDALFVVCPAADIYQGIDIIYMLKSPGICSF